MWGGEYFRTSFTELDLKENEAIITVLEVTKLFYLVPRQLNIFA